MTSEALDHRSIGVLGLVTIGVYGSWYYSYGVLLDPLLADTGWRESGVAAAFSVGLVLIGVGAVFGGRALDLVGHRLVFLAGGVVSGASLLLASVAEAPFLFALAAAVGLGVSGALGFYHVTMAAVVRLHPTRSARAIAVLTIWGAFASPIFLPLTAWLVEQLTWRESVRVLAACMFGSFVLGAFGVRAPAPAGQGPDVVPLRQVIRTILATGRARWFTAAVAFGGLAMSTLLVYQVPTMTAAGLPAATAATMAGLRGFFQLGGRLPIGALVARIGSDWSLVLAMIALGTGGLLLLASDTVLIAAVFAVVAGFGIGAFSPLQGMMGNELFDSANLGATLGFLSTVALVMGAAGPTVAGVVVEATGDRGWAAILVAVAGFAAAGCIVGMRSADAAAAQAENSSQSPAIE